MRQPSRRELFAMRNSMLRIAAGLLVVTAVLVAGTAAPAGTSGAGTSATMVKLRIHLKGTSHTERVSRGRFTLSGTIYTRAGGVSIRSGTISDRGTFVHRTGVAPRGAVPGAAPFVRKLRGAKGTIWVHRDVGVAPGPRQSGRCGRPGPGVCGMRWRITKATGAYAGLRGRGRDWVVPEDQTDLTMIGNVYR